jgi:hypothetical protein
MRATKATFWWRFKALLQAQGKDIPQDYPLTKAKLGHTKPLRRRLRLHFDPIGH